MSIRALLFVSVGLALAPAARCDTGRVEQATGPSLAESRMLLDKWIEIQQLTAKERKEWQQGKEVLQSRIELVRKEITTIEEKSKQVQGSVAEAGGKREAVVADNARLKKTAEKLAESVAKMEDAVRKLYKTLPDPVATRLKALYDRIPADAAKTKVSLAERFQNVLGILNEVNRSNADIPVVQEVHNMADGRPVEVRVMYIGLARAYYLSAGGDAGIGRPSTNGWTWTPSEEVARSVRKAIEIQQGKQAPAFVPLPMEFK